MKIIKSTNRYIYGLFISVGSLCMAPLSAYADNYQTSVQCAYSHTLGDDAILMFGMPGHAMWHDFFGNTGTNASSIYASLQASPTTTCTDLADSSAYWAPSLRLPDETEVRPAYQKTYYQTVNSTENPLTSFPPGLQLLAGDHKGTAPNPYINFLCNDGKGYSHDAERTCLPPSTSEPIQLDIAIQFPNCWDGKTIAAKPSDVTHQSNAVYADASGACPADYPKHIPTVNMNVAYLFPGVASLDLSKVQLSLDPIMNGDQRIDQWGSIYTAHGDFINGWAPAAANFMTERCMNNNYDCTSYMPYLYVDPIADTYVSNKDDSGRNFGGSDQLLVQGDISNAAENNNPEKITLLKYQIPPVPTSYSAEESALFKYTVHLYGGRSTSSGAQIIYIYQTSTDWDENSVTWNNHPACTYKPYASMYLDEKDQYRDFDVTSMVKQAQQAGQQQIAFCVGGDTQNHDDIYTFGAKGTHYSPQLMVVGVQPE
ncbi:DUF1996 domain-containing protein [Paraburkholderia sediminicola]|uniref:CBM96 family carbohydrate-binding protein n=1 Tax=Paraburkholderia sediminicola TaxID=458836 RepID=UPI00131C8899